jgi:serine/threonine protein phosphatase PrpC
MTITRRQPLEDGDVLMVCTDGVWSNLKDVEIASS